jgi:hypothetical protein
MRYTLQPNQWYACEFIGDQFDEDRTSYSPIRVNNFETLGTGRRQFRLSFYHANYPAGVRDKSYELETIERGTRFLLARSAEHQPTRILLIYDIDWNWLQRHFQRLSHEKIDIQLWLDQNT